MQAVDPALLAELHLLEAAAGGDSLLDFVARSAPGMVRPDHLKPVADLIAQAKYGPVRACISLGPRSGKTVLIESAIAWWMSERPRDYCAYLTYGHELAANKSLETMSLAERNGVKLAKLPRRADEWHTTHDGALLARGVGGALTGYGVNLMFVDDPYKNRRDAESPITREQIWEWFTGVALTRLQPGASCFVIHARWHEDDIIGRLMREQGENWVQINLPSVDDEGEPLWPWFWTKEALAQRRREVGEYDWASLYMGRPQPRGGAMFKHPTYYEVANRKGVTIMAACDPAASKSNRADHSAIVVGAGWLGPNNEVFVDVLDVWRGRVEVPELVRRLKAVQDRWWCPVAVEAVGGFKAIPQALREVNRGLRVIEVKAAADKFTRAQPLVSAWNAGRVRLPLPDKHKWVFPVVQETSNFTGLGDREDDQVDALAHLYTSLAEVLHPKRAPIDYKKLLPFG